jgi:hypothetical protein
MQDLEVNSVGRAIQQAAGPWLQKIEINNKAVRVCQSWQRRAEVKNDSIGR